MNTNMTGFRWFSKNLSVLVLLTKLASASEGLRIQEVNTLKAFIQVVHVRRFYSWGAMHLLANNKLKVYLAKHPQCLQDQYDVG